MHPRQVPLRCDALCNPEMGPSRSGFKSKWTQGFLVISTDCHYRLNISTTISSIISSCAPLGHCSEFDVRTGFWIAWTRIRPFEDLFGLTFLISRPFWTDQEWSIRERLQSETHHSCLTFFSIISETKL